MVDHSSQPMVDQPGFESKWSTLPLCTLELAPNLSDYTCSINHFDIIIPNVLILAIFELVATDICGCTVAYVVAKDILCYIA